MKIEANELARATQRAVMMGLATLTGVMPCVRARADTFAEVHYSAKTDQLVITMAYRGTNADHAFSLQWGECENHDDGAHEVSAEVLDSQWQDVEQSDFTKTTRFALTDMPCRPATVTLRSAPRFFYTVRIPAKASRQR